MNRKVVALVLVICMVFGIFGLVAAQGGNEDSPGGMGVQMRAGAGGQDDDPEELDGPPYGPPELSEGLNRLGVRHKILSRNRVLVNGHPLDSDLPPVIIEGRILIPVRAVCVSLDAEVDWDAETGTITITRDDVVVVIVIGEEGITVNGEPFAMDVPSQIIGNRTFVPLRFIAIALGDDVEWCPQAGKAYIRRGKPVTEQD